MTDQERDGFGERDGLGERLRQLLPSEQPDIRQPDAVFADVQARHRRHRQRRAALAAVPVVLAVVAVGLFVIASRGGNSNLETDRPAAVNPQCGATIPIPPGLSPDKAAGLQQLERNRELHCDDTPTTAPPSTSGPLGPGTTPTTAPWASGIINATQYPLYGKTYRFTTAWQGIVGSDHVQVFAGSISASGQGVVIVRRTAVSEHDINNATTTVINAPNGTTQLALTSGTYPTLEATDTNGATYTINAAEGTITRG